MRASKGEQFEIDVEGFDELAAGLWLKHREQCKSSKIILVRCGTLQDTAIPIPCCEHGQEVDINVTSSCPDSALQ